MKITKKVEDRIKTSAAKFKKVLEAAKNSGKIAPFIEGKTVVKEIFVPGKLVNLVVR